MDDKRRALIKEQIKLYTAANTVSAEVARAALIREGLYTDSGKLKPEYGGPETDDKGRRKNSKVA